MRYFYTAGIVLAFFQFAQAQSTLSEIRSIFQANCTNGCHSGGSPDANLDLNGNTNALYDALVNVTPENSVAASKGYKLIDPGYPERSFLLRKCATPAWDDNYELDTGEGSQMPNQSLAKEDIELIRQWVFFGAPQNGSVVDPQTLSDFYNGMGMERIDPIPTPQQEGETGYQIRMGPFFLPPLSEVEYRWKHDINEPSAVEVYRTKAQFNEESHHFILYKFDAGASNFEEGFRPATGSDFGSLDISQVTAWADPTDNVLPATTAYKWPSNTVLDVNFHVLNYEQDSVLAAEAYVNVYTQPNNTADLEMFSQLIPINTLDALVGTGNFGDDLIIPGDGQVHTFTDAFYIPIQIPDWYVWQLSSHTHEWGIDYDIYTRNANGTRGSQIYEGFYNTDYTFNQGYYDWAHPPVRTFDPLLHVDMAEGFIHEAKYINATGQTINWGLTTDDEMMLFSLQYTEGPIVAVSDGNTNESDFDLNISPNPFLDELKVAYFLPKASNVNIQLYNSVGAKISDLRSQQQMAGRHQISLPENKDLSEGIYFLHFQINEQQFTRKIIKL